MLDDLHTEYPEAAEYIQEAVDEHGEEWVLDNYYNAIHPLGKLIEVPDKDELPFYDDAQHDTLESDEIAEMYRARATYRENLREVGKTDDT